MCFVVNMRNYFITVLLLLAHRRDIFLLALSTGRPVGQDERKHAPEGEVVKIPPSTTPD